MRFAKEAWPFVLPFALLACLLAALRRGVWAVACAVTGGLVLLFFRDPDRRCDGGAELVVAPADGKVLAVDEIDDPALGGTYRRVITFLSVFDVHTQRVPVAGEVVHSALTRGRKLAAFDSRAGEVNEQHTTVIRRPNGDLVGVRQIAGLVARRVVCYLQPGELVLRGQSLGVIKFGSRVDLLVPLSYRIEVQVGDRIRNGETVMAVSESPGARR